MTDPARVAIVQAAIDDLAAIGQTRAHAWAVAIINALDAHDAGERLEHPRGQMTWADETDEDEDPPDDTG